MRPWPTLRNAAGPLLPRGLLGLIGLVVATETFVARHDADFGNFETIEWGRSARAASGEAVGAQILLFGDSQVKSGLLPRVLDARTGMASYNLAVLAGQAPASYFLLGRALNAGAMPAAVVVDFKSFLLATGPRSHIDRWPDLLDAHDRLDLAREAGDASLFAHLTLARHLPTFRSRGQIRHCLARSLQGENASLRFTDFLVRRNMTRNRGSFVMPSRVPPLTTGGEETSQIVPDHWGIHPVNAAFLGRFFELAEAHRIKVFWLLPPDFPGVQEAMVRSGADAAYLRIVRRLMDRFPNLTVLDGRDATYPADCFHDPLHLDARGAVALSEDVAEALAEAVRPGKARRAWINLPDYRERSTTALVETLDQTRLALEQYDPGQGVRR